MFTLVIKGLDLKKIIPIAGGLTANFPTSAKRHYMLSKKSKGLFIEVNGFSYLVAAVTGLGTPFTVESITSFPRHEPGKLKEFLDRSSVNRRSRYLHAHCGIIPESRFFRLHTLESMTKAKEPNYFSQVLEQQFRIHPQASQFAVVNALNGERFMPDKPLAGQKDFLICGADAREVKAFQENLLECGIFPQSLQLSTLSCLAGIKHYLRGRGKTDPVLLIEMAQNSSNLFILSNDKVELCRAVNFGFNAVLPVIQEELGLKDEESARSLFFADAFDFREVGARLFKKMLKELNASTGFYEVQTGQTISSVYMTSLPDNLSWIPQIISREMDIPMLDIAWSEWCDEIGISFGDACSPGDLGPSSFGLFSLFVNFESNKDAVRDKK